MRALQKVYSNAEMVFSGCCIHEEKKNVFENRNVN